MFGAAALASNLGVSTLVIGLTVVAFGTSAPEMLVSGMAAWSGYPGMGIGNAIGSNITNVTLVLGAAFLVRPLRIHSRLLIRELPILVLIMLIAWGFLANGYLSRLEGIVLLVGMCVLVVWVVVQGSHESRSDADPLTSGFTEGIPQAVTIGNASTWLALGLVLLLGGSRLLVWGAEGIAISAGVSDLVIGLTLVAFGTSLPELAASIAAARRNEQDIAVGNVVGSNMFNLLGVLGLPGVIAPGPVDEEVVTRDFPIMFGVTLLLMLMAWIDKRNHVGRARGITLLLIYAAYVGYLFASPGHSAVAVR